MLPSGIENGLKCLAQLTSTQADLALNAKFRGKGRDGYEPYPSPATLSVKELAALRFPWLAAKFPLRANPWGPGVAWPTPPPPPQRALPPSLISEASRSHRRLCLQKHLAKPHKQARLMGPQGPPQPSCAQEPQSPAQPPQAFPPREQGGWEGGSCSQRG